MRCIWWLALLVLVTFSSSSADDDEGEEYALVTRGTAVKLQHIQTKFRLHSHDIKWGSGSAQQSVTAVAQKDDPNSLWKVSGGHGEHCPQGTPVKHGQTIRLTHVQTKRNLHSHGYQSPLSKQQEISCFGEKGRGDRGDNWVVQVQDGDHWMRGKRVRFQHKDTLKFLHTHDSFKFDRSNCGHNCPIAGQQEVTAYQQVEDQGNFWKTSEGLYYPNNAKA